MSSLWYSSSTSWLEEDLDAEEEAELDGVLELRRVDEEACKAGACGRS